MCAATAALKDAGSLHGPAMLSSHKYKHRQQVNPQKSPPAVTHQAVQARALLLQQQLVNTTSHMNSPSKECHLLPPMGVQSLSNGRTSYTAGSMDAPKLFAR